jgi:hypothetical protein
MEVRSNRPTRRVLFGSRRWWRSAWGEGSSESRESMGRAVCRLCIGSAASLQEILWLWARAAARRRRRHCYAVFLGSQTSRTISTSFALPSSTQGRFISVVLKKSLGHLRRIPCTQAPRGRCLLPRCVSALSKRAPWFPHPRRRPRPCASTR